MVQKLRRDPGSTQILGAFHELAIVDGGPQLRQLHRKIGELHLSGQHVPEGPATTLRTTDDEFITRHKQRREKGKALYVVPMRMAEENCGAYRLFRFDHQARPERPRPRSAIENETVAAIRRRFHARRVSSEARRTRSRRRNRASSPPKSQSQLSPPSMRSMVSLY